MWGVCVCVCVKDKSRKCERKLRTTLQYEMGNETDRSTVRNRAAMEAAVEGKNCRESAEDEVPVRERTICKEELSDMDEKGRNVVTEIAK